MWAQLSFRGEELGRHESRSMTCKEAEELLPEWALGELSVSRRAQLDDHLLTCVSCAECGAELKQSVAALDSWTETEPSPQLLARTLVAVEKEQAKPRGLADRYNEFVHWLVNTKVGPLGGSLVAVAGALVFLVLLSSRTSQIASSVPTCQENVRDLGKALMQYRQAHNGQAAEHLTELIPDAFLVLPICPQAEAETYSQGYEVDAKSQEFVLRCYGEHHGAKEIPSFSSLKKN